MADKSIDSTKTFEVVTDKEGIQYRRTIAHLPSYYRTDANEKFLGSTLDQIIQKGKLDRLDGYIGRLDAYTRSISDRYLTATTKSRTSYQLEPTVTYTDKDTFFHCIPLLLNSKGYIGIASWPFMVAHYAGNIDTCVIWLYNFINI